GSNVTETTGRAGAACDSDFAFAATFAAAASWAACIASSISERRMSSQISASCVEAGSDAAGACFDFTASVRRSMRASLFSERSGKRARIPLTNTVPKNNRKNAVRTDGMVLLLTDKNHGATTLARKGVLIDSCGSVVCINADLMA